MYTKNMDIIVEASKNRWNQLCSRQVGNSDWESSVYLHWGAEPSASFEYVLKCGNLSRLETNAPVCPAKWGPHCGGIVSLIKHLFARSPLKPADWWMWMQLLRPRSDLSSVFH